MTTNRLKVAIVQDYVPKYRVEFFTQLVSHLREARIDCVVVAGVPRGTESLRSDAAANEAWMSEFQSRRFILGGHTFVGHGTNEHWRDCDGVILGLRGTSLDLYTELIREHSTGRRVGVWGHIGSFVKPPIAMDLALERWQMRHSDHVFAYEQEGASIAKAAGVRPENITVVMNSVGTSELLDAYKTLEGNEINQILHAAPVVPGRVFGFVGAIDAPKRIQFLAEALDLLWKCGPEIKFCISGAGAEENLLEIAIRRGQVIMLGYGSAVEKASVFRVSQAIVNPGRIGLLAVECLAVGIPLITTAGVFHGPEFHYLTPGKDVLVSKNEVSDFVKLILSQVGLDGVFPLHVGSDYPTLDSMVENFSHGVQSMME